MAFQASGIMPLALQNQPTLPELAAHVWKWFLELHTCRGNNGFGPCNISFSDIASWMAVTGNKLVEWELSAIQQIDAAYIKQVSKK